MFVVGQLCSYLSRWGMRLQIVCVFKLHFTRSLIYISELVSFRWIITLAAVKGLGAISDYTHFHGKG